MFSFINKSLDDYVIRQVTARFRPPLVPDPHIGEAEKLLVEPDFFCDSIQAPADLRFRDAHAFSFRSPVTTPAEENNTVYGRFYGSGKDWQRRPSVLLLHGWNAEKAYECSFPWLAWRLTRLGVNAAMIQLPYHGDRKPPRPAEGYVSRNFISSDLHHMIQAARQAVADARAMVGWLLAQGSSSVGVWGISMGGWLAGLLTCHDPRLGFSVLQSPLVNLDSAINALSFCEPIRQGLGGRSMALNRLNLACSQPLTRLDKTLLVECRDDRFIAVEDVETVWRAWKEPVIWRVPYGHITVLMSWRVMERIVRWINVLTRA